MALTGVFQNCAFGYETYSTVNTLCKLWTTPFTCTQTSSQPTCTSHIVSVVETKQTQLQNNEDSRHTKGVLQMCPQNFSLGQRVGAQAEGGGNPKAIYHLCLILKTMLQKPCHKYNCNIPLSAIAFTYIQIQLHVPWLTYLLSIKILFFQFHLQHYFSKF